MEIDQIELTEVEKRFLVGSSDTAVTGRRIRLVLVAAAVYVFLLVAVALFLKSWLMILIVSLVYIGVTVWEKLAYGRGVLVYKSIIQKLVRRVEKLEEVQDR